MASKSFREEYESIGTFLVLELLALVAFGLGGVNIIFQYAGFIVALVATFFAFKSFTKEDLVPIALIAGPIVLLSIFSSFGKFFDAYPILYKLGAFLGMISFLAMGLTARRMKSFTAKNALYCIGGGIGLITLISTVITWSQYGLFYPLIHAKAGSYYYNGSLYSILNEMSWLNGFKISEFSINYGGLFALLCSSFLSILLFLDYKKDRKLFIFSAIIGGIGLISMISIPNFYALIFSVSSFGFALYYRYLRTNSLANKIVNYGASIFAGFVLAFLIFAILNVIVPGVHSTIEKADVLNRLFNSNRIMVVANPVLEAALKPFNLFGIRRGNDYVNGYIISDKVVFANSGCFEVELIKEAGLLGFVCFLIFAIFAFMSFTRYIKYAKDEHHVKVFFLTFVAGFVLYTLVCYDAYPVTHSEYSFYPATQSTVFYLILFVIGYTILPKGKEEISFASTPKEEKKVKTNPDDDYNFSDVVEEEII